ncbi:MAG: prepilin peptidase [Deltaproteobacteria bacterium]|nr:prepilin peptidase [Deltaproteobacteria bacterium]
MPEALIYIFVFAFFACVGSFLNVCIRRIPEGSSIVSPPSSCPVCQSSIKFYDNIPILSYLALLGRCRKCKTRISPEYPLVEALMGLLGIALLIKFGVTPRLFIWGLFTSALVAISFIDLRHRIIPNVISLPGIPVGVILVLYILYPDVKGALLHSGLGIVLGGGILYAVAELYLRVTGNEGMGYGDVKLLAMIGAFIGFKGVFFTLLSGSIIGSIIGGTFMLIKGKDSKYAIPFGPFLSLGALSYIFVGDFVIAWYINTLWVQ